MKSINTTLPILIAIINILKYFGVVINDPTIIDAAAQEAQATEINLKS